VGNFERIHGYAFKAEPVHVNRTRLSTLSIVMYNIGGELVLTLFLCY